MYDFQFTYKSLQSQLQKAIDTGYSFMTIEEYYNKSKLEVLPQKLIVNRVDIDFSCKKAKRLAEIFNDLGIKATFFVRLHAKEYNPFDFENYLCLKFIKESGHEIGYHSEVMDEAFIWEEDPSACLKRDIDILEKLLDINIKGVASHGGMTGINNLDFWREKKASDYNVLYEAYDNNDAFNLFFNSFYISDSEWTRWKCYANGILVRDDHRNLAEHLDDGHNLIYLLIHPDTYYERHFYE